MIWIWLMMEYTYRQWKKRWFKMFRLVVLHAEKYLPLIRSNSVNFIFTALPDGSKLLK